MPKTDEIQKSGTIRPEQAGKLVSRLLTPTEITGVSGGAYNQTPYAQHFQTPGGPNYKQSYDQSTREVPATEAQ